jgi:hypothetical protein
MNSRLCFLLLSFAVVSLTTFPFASSVIAQEIITGKMGVPGCGDPRAKFEVKKDNGQHLAQLVPGKALVYLLEDDSEFISTPDPTTLTGLDGNWIGATHGNSHFYFFVDPGIHHLCASWQSKVIVGQAKESAAAQFVAKADDVYYFAVKNTWGRERGPATISLKPLDSDQGQLLVNKYPFSISQQKK